MKQTCAVVLMAAFTLVAQPPAGKKGGMTAEQMARKKAEYVQEHPPRESVGLIPLCDLGRGWYKGEQGGLYPDGENNVPAGHLEARRKIAGTVTPLDAEGRRSVEGRIALVSIGFSNPSIEFSAFKPAAEANPKQNPRLVVINGCVGARAAQTIADPNSDYWGIVSQRITEAGVTPKQVQAIWMKQVIPGSGPFPAYPKRLQGYLEESLHIAMERFPNLKLVYLSSRTYGGYTETGGSPESDAYETGFAVKWLIADQLAGKPELNYDPAKGKVRAPWLAWGPYLWTDGVKGRKDGFVYLRADTREDALHPSDAGTGKIVKLLMDFFETDPTARPWFARK
ncbi:MAG TPA: hypothetical protein VL285_17990 [Bryobacteraceae bacterium]|jgi:hypothetical protein|nr:hypothetical protein [Bryobacteraceae bacterium]